MTGIRLIIRSDDATKSQSRLCASETYAGVHVASSSLVKGVVAIGRPAGGATVADEKRAAALGDRVGDVSKGRAK